MSAMVVFSSASAATVFWAAAGASCATAVEAAIGPAAKARAAARAVRAVWDIGERLQAMSPELTRSRPARQTNADQSGPNDDGRRGSPHAGRAVSTPPGVSERQRLHLRRQQVDDQHRQQIDAAADREDRAVTAHALEHMADGLGHDDAADAAEHAADA